ncbi:winged helix-turn-helix transcriptional regulator [Chitinophaga sp. 30R24]|uniref:winged helix-turn-helix transcriptional regulator n=1 Tax=Chitinophaga sp. 30R24 TaxID=3248838 RepID=UPI003B90D671
MYEKKISVPLTCGLTLTKEVLNGKWKANLIYAISQSIKRPSDILRAIPDATKRVLNLQLKELEEYTIISKKIYHQLPPKVEYSLTPLGESLMPIIEAMNNWGEHNRPLLEQVIGRTGNNHEEVEQGM